MCCGRPRPSPPLGGRRETIPASGAIVEYVGRTALTATGPVTGRLYRFAASGARLKVDARDLPALAKVAVLRRIG
jgi:hypothetical protein